MSTSSFYADAVLFDMDGTLTDSIQAVEAAWGNVAEEIGQDRQHVIAATHGKRAIDNLSQFKPHIKSHQMDDEVTKFEESILYFADAYNTKGPGSRRNSMANTPADSPLASGSATPALSSGKSSAPSSRHGSFAAGARRPSFGQRLGNILSMTGMSRPTNAGEPQVVGSGEDTAVEDPMSEVVEDEEIDEEQLKAEWKKEVLAKKEMDAWEIEAASIDRSVRILPGVKKMMDSIPMGKYAVATSGAKTYAYGCMTRVGITPPPVTITADDKRLKNGKPFPDPFLLAAKELGFDAKKCVVFEDSPSGIRAGVASGATVIALCTSHERSKIENCGAHFLVENMENVKCEVEGDRLKFTVTQ